MSCKRDCKQKNSHEDERERYHNVKRARLGLKIRNQDNQDQDDQEQQEKHGDYYDDDHDDDHHQPQRQPDLETLLNVLTTGFADSSEQSDCHARIESEFEHDNESRLVKK